MSTGHSRFEHLAAWVRRMAMHRPETPEVYQSSTISALLDGVYDGDITIAELLRHGDFGLGTFDRLDGEMVILDGVCYHLRADGSASRAEPDDRTPFAAVTWFRAQTTLTVDTATDRAAVFALIDSAVSSPNLIHAIAITGSFDTVRTRTVAAQTRPYPPLAEVSDHQAEMVFAPVAGTIIGFRTPDFEQGIAVAGYHLHFLNDTHTGGGHVLEFALRSGRIAISTASELHLRLPTTGAFLTAELDGGDIGAQIRHAEGGG
ncbi:acetolactate decarboxylase [Mycolicibacterium sp. 120266]|uniref:acetolactate decarboxylase n=1 Tax=Mycolicibacterium sp. 120266 TaxID=3090601 RepID=UPI00299DF8CF|nr:acetolactate decarboxylase [Mycolicibacterium sp. 120266]MDX1872478.1 acetolactate decarboxylase [Mycolicibacterium sp. 120266]